MFKVLLSHLQYITRIGKEDVSTFSVASHVLMLTLLKCLELTFIAGHCFHPTCLVQTYWFPATLGTIFIFETILNNLELQLADGANDLTVIELIDEQLRHTFVHKLIDAFLQLFGFHWVGILDVLKHLGREGGKTTIMQFFAFAQCVAYFKGSVVGQTNDIAWPSLIDGLFALRHELRGAGESKRLALTDMQIRRIPNELA